jgi:hypothetical protein
MAFSNEFERELDKLFRERTHWLKAGIWGSARPGKPPGFNRKKVDAGIGRLQDIASKALVKGLLRSEFDKHVTSRRSWFVKGRGHEEKKRNFEKWFGSWFEQGTGCVYAFWNEHGRCIYVGRSGAGGSRPASHFKEQAFSKATRVTIYKISSKSQISKLECLAIHSFQPLVNKNRSGGGSGLSHVRSAINGGTLRTR